MLLLAPSKLYHRPLHPFEHSAMPNHYCVVPTSPHLVWTARTELRAPYTALTALLGQPHRNRWEKTRVDWILERIGAPSETFYIHDCADDLPVSEVHSNRPYDWQVLGTDEPSLTAFCLWLSGRVIAQVGQWPPARQLTAASRARINELVRQGATLADAMKRGAEWEWARSAAGDYAWPTERTRIRPCCQPGPNFQ